MIPVRWREALPSPGRIRRRCVILGLVLLLAAALPSTPALGQTAASPPPDTTATAGTMPSLGLFPRVQLVDGGGEDFALPIQLLLLLTVLTLAPAIIILMTSFTRLVVILGILRQALGIQQAPPSQVLIGLALFLTLFIMYPVFQRIHDDALQPYVAGEIGQQEALDRATRPLKGFMLAQTREKDLMLFMDMAAIGTFQSADEVPLHVLVPAFVISELRIAFQIGFMIFLPFLIVDLVVASVLMSMGMMMLPPVMVSLPIKLLLFVLADGWYLIVESVIQGYALP
ncbi:flagellar type III secretion system pore protein FliP [Rhodocaloribacter litoris]|uniref:flagellar type III secretion system pore protein FliP n=1 Tax=Rhodocaloribacter litoris TaxID=2558931 RepID=UPI001E4E9BAA|nr:flagellar type III secretion system pore protein FliP [Rhodocaloribacter litoris]